MFFRVNFLLILFVFCASLPGKAQKTQTIEGLVTDVMTRKPIGFVTIASPGNKLSTRSDENGRFVFRSQKKIKELRFSCIGYKTQSVDIPADSLQYHIDVALEPKAEELKEVVIKPQKYRNKDNPTVELIQLVVKNRDRNRVENFNSYRVEQYEKVMMGLTNMSEKVKSRRFLRSWKFVLDNVDTSSLSGAGVVPIYLQENLQDYNSQGKPKRHKTIVKASKRVRFPLLDDEGIDKYLRYMYQDVDLYDNYVVLLTDHFLSPIANNAPNFYRYYPVDTIVENGTKIVRLQFFPRNKTDMLLQGELSVALDSTYPVTRASFTVNPQINLNWVNSIQCEQTFQQTPNAGKWVLSEENYALDFGITKRSMGIFGERYVSHKLPEMGVSIPDSVFDRNFEDRIVLQNAEINDDTFWVKNRHVALDAVEVATYKNMDSLQQTLLFKRIAKTAYILIVGHWKPVPGFEIGRINTFYSFNPIEGNRFRFGGRTNPDFSKRINLEGYVAYGLKDERWKYGIGANISLSKRPYNKFPYNLLRINYQEDLMTPGVLIIGTFAPSSLATSLTRGTNDRFLFQKRFLAQYEHELPNHLSFMGGLERRELGPLGSLQFEPTDDILTAGTPVTTTKPFFQVRYAPGEEFYQTKNGWRQRIRFNYIAQVRYARGIKGLWNGGYDLDEVTASFYKFSNTPPFGYNFFYFETGGIFGKAPYPLLTMHRGNQTYGYRFMAYNLMNFMEFVSDRYAGVNIEQSFYGYFTNKIPVVKKLKLREFATLKVLYGQVSDQNKPVEGSGLYKFPTLADGTPLTYTLEKKPYVEASIGIGNIFKVLRIDIVRRFTYLDHPQTSEYGIRVAGQMQF